MSSSIISVRVTWEKVFPEGPGCDEVEFLIKSHPLDSPSNYKLSDLTLKGKRTAVLAVPPGEDFIFQVDKFIIYQNAHKSPFFSPLLGDCSGKQGPRYWY